jgi:hypothetical protein
MVFIKRFFNLWRFNAERIRSFREYDNWCETVEEELQEVEYSIKNGMDPIFWCRNCKYSDCEIHT